MAGPSFWIDSRGCAKNQVDAEILSSLLEGSGWIRAEGPEEAALLIVNSCGFIESAKRESIDALISLRREFPDKRVVMAGCLSERYGEELASSLEEADAVVGNGDLEALPAFLRGIAESSPRRGGRAAVLRPDRAEPRSGADRRKLLSLPGSAYLKVSEGCSNRCSYCAIPIIRGEQRSRPLASIAEEAGALERRGIKEIVLVGQDLGAFGSDAALGEGLAALVKAVLAATSTAWIRVLYIHPSHFPREILDIAGAQPRFLPYFDIPFQHVSASVLARMKRKGGREEALALVSSIREALPDAIIRSTFLLGFPGEDAADLGALESFLEEARLDWAGFFAYSREEGTQAASLPGRIGKREAERRAARFRVLQDGISSERMGKFSGRTLDVLVEERIRDASEEGDALSLGRAYLQAPEVDGLTVISGEAPGPGEIVRCRILGAAGIDLDARAEIAVGKRLGGA
jgi:ribosomal protein S12 methylthiotransferase